MFDVCTESLNLTSFEFDLFYIESDLMSILIMQVGYAVRNICHLILDAIYQLTEFSINLIFVFLSWNVSFRYDATQLLLYDIQPVAFGIQLNEPLL